MTLVIVDKVLTVIFSLEMIVKIIAFGVINCGSTSYLRSNWNLLDMIIVIISVSIKYRVMHLVRLIWLA